MKSNKPHPISTTREITEIYYDSAAADNFYFNIWGGEDIHIGIYDKTSDIPKASRQTINHMAALVPQLSKKSRVIDFGAGYGGAARYLASGYGCEVVCVNLSAVQNRTNRRLNVEQNLDGLIEVIHGNFEEIAQADEVFDVVWSQDAILHSSNRKQVLSEAWRVLKPGGIMIFTDPMQTDNCPVGVLQPVYDRIHLDNLASFAFYRHTAMAHGFTECKHQDLTPNLEIHYSRILDGIKKNYSSACKQSSKDYIDQMIVGLQHWIDAAKAGYLAWGIITLQKPK